MNLKQVHNLLDVEVYHALKAQKAAKKDQYGWESYHEGKAANASWEIRVEGGYTVCYGDGKHLRIYKDDDLVAIYSHNTELEV